MDSPDNSEVERLARQFCALVDPVLEQLYGSNAEADLHQTNPAAAKDIAVTLQDSVRQLWVENANRGQQQRLQNKGVVAHPQWMLWLWSPHPPNNPSHWE